jgi:hypothetical protein
VLLQAACPPVGSKRRSGLDDIEDEVEDDDDDRSRRRRPSSDDDDDNTSSGGGGDDSAVNVTFEQLPDAVVERNDAGIPRQNVVRLRQILCEGRPGEAIIFYRLIVSTHWHYYWLCSDNRARRASSRYGANHIRNWLKGFRRQAATLSGGCSAASKKAVLRGTHESGVRATAYCNGQIVLRFPDGGKTIKSYSSQGYASGGSAAPTAPTYGGSAESCPPCPVCPRGGGVRGAGDCPQPRPCPPPRECPPPKQCPACDCKKQMIDAGKKGFFQGVGKACARICMMIYNECRRLNPKTAMCHMLQEFCNKRCTK